MGTKYVSGRVKELKIGITNYSESKESLSVVGRIVGAATSNAIPFLYSNYSDLPSAATYHGAFAHVHATQKAYYAHGGNWSELVNREQTGVVGTGTDQYNIGITSVTTLTATTVSASSTITASKFVGDGSGLTGVTASGTGIIIKDGGSLVGTAGTINFATNLSVSAISGAAVTVTGATDNNPNVATLVVSGISTLTELEVNSRYGVTSGFGTFVAAAGVAYTINQFTIASNNFKSAEYTVHIERENTQQVQKVLVMQNGSAAYSSEYGIIYNPSLIASIGASVAGGVMKLEVTPETGQTGLTTYRFTRETMK